jgi:hypothetical protein
MKTFSATDAAISGFGLVRAHPKAVGAWVIISTVVSAVVAVITVGLFGAQLEAFANLSQNNATPDPSETLRMMGGLVPAMLCSSIYSIVFYSVLMAAIYRAVLRPADNRQAYLRFGADELRQAGVSILLVLLFFAAYMGVVLVLAILIGILSVVSKPVGGLAAVLLVPAGLGALLYFAVRLSLANVLTFAKGKIDIFGSMTLTKGRFWPMFGAYVVATILAIVVYLLLFLIVTMLGGALSGFNMESLGNLMQSQTTSLESLMTPTGILSLAVGGLIAVLTSVTIYTPSAMIYREIATDEESTIDTFA